MSAGALLREALARVRSLALPPTTEGPMVRVLEEDREGRTFLADAAWEAWNGHQARTRGAGVLLWHAASNLGDDLSDGEATYLERPAQLAPAVQWTLQHLGTSLLLEAGTSREALTHASKRLAQAGSWAVDEWLSTHWDAPRYRRFAEGIAGLQLDAYLSLLWDGTPLAHRAGALGVPLGALSLVGADAREQKARWRALPETDRREVATWAAVLATGLSAAPEACIQRALRTALG